MQEWICIHECFQFSTHLFIGDVIQGEENPGHHFSIGFTDLQKMPMCY